MSPRAKIKRKPRRRKGAPSFRTRQWWHKKRIAEGRAKKRKGFARKAKPAAVDESAGPLKPQAPWSATVAERLRAAEDH